MNEEIKSKIEKMVKENKILLFMKGDRNQPMCGFSAQVIQALGKHEVSYETFNILDDWDIRESVGNSIFCPNTSPGIL